MSDGIQQYDEFDYEKERKKMEAIANKRKAEAIARLRAEKLEETGKGRSKLQTQKQAVDHTKTIDNNSEGISVKSNAGPDLP